MLNLSSPMFLEHLLPCLATQQHFAKSRVEKMYSHFMGSVDTGVSLDLNSIMLHLSVKIK